MNDLQWILICSGLVFLMQPGFMCLESGLTRSKNSINVAIKNLADFGISAGIFWCFGYALMFGLSWQGLIGTKGFFLDVSEDFTWGAFFFFEVMFCSITTTIISGAVAERIKFNSYIIIAIITSSLIYPVFGHWVWNGLALNSDSLTGWLGKLGFIDFAGCSVVHSIGAWVALAVLIIIGARQGRFNEQGQRNEMNGSNLPLSVLGVMLLWIGWFGFNGGSSFAFNAEIPRILVNTLMGGVAGMIGGYLISIYQYQLVKIELLINGTIAGLVSVTGSCHLISTPQAVIIAGIGTFIMYRTKIYLEQKGIDDAVNAVAVHGGAGIWGTLAVALFVPAGVLNTGLSTIEQILVQLLGILVCFVWGFGVTWLILSNLDRFFPLRVSVEDENIGLNISEHGAKTDLNGLLMTMKQHMTTQDLSLRVPVEPFTEVGTIANYYNRVIDSLEKSTIELEATNQQLNELTLAKEKAEIASETKSLFLANMSHELRTPMNAILGFSQIMMRSPSLTSEERENITIINRSGNYLLNLINNILDLSKIEAGKMTLNSTSFDLYSLIQEIEDLLLLKVQTQGLELHFDISRDVPRYIYTDGTKLRQVLINLVNNGIKFTEQGSVNVTVNLASCPYEASNAGQVHLLFSVTDTGVGIKTEDLDKVFEAFIQTDVGRKSKEGTGLGLAISQKFVQLMGGNIYIESQLGQGSNFSFDIQATLAEGESANLEQANQFARVVALQPGQPRYRLLIVDDSSINRLLLTKILEPFDFQLKQAGNGSEAIAIASEWQPDLIWMDMRMPITDGYQATQQIKATLPDTIIIGLTASVSEEEKEEILAVGCDDYLKKPFLESAIFEVMAKYLGLKYIYEEKPTNQDKNILTQPLTTENLQLMPSAWLEQLYQAAVDLDDEMILELVKQIPTQHQNLAEQLINLVNNYQLVKIRKLLE